MIHLLLALLSACTGGAPDQPDRPHTFPDPQLDRTGASPVHQLWLERGRYALPDHNLPPSFQSASRFELALTARDKPRRKGVAYEAVLPFDVGDAGRLFAPVGMEVHVEGEAVPFTTAADLPAWRLKDGKLVVVWDEALPSDPTVVVTWPGVQQSLERRSFGSAGLEASEFVKHEITLDQRTREGLLLPAPGTAEWDLELPEGAVTFDGYVALEPSAITSHESDGAKVSLAIVADGETREVDTVKLRGPSTAYKHWSVDLSAWAGRAVTLRLATYPGSTTTFDHVFIGAPSVWGPPSGPVRRVVVIGLDTTRPDHLGVYGYDRDTSPELDQFAAHAAVFDNAHTPAPRTRPSFRSATTGMNPLDAVGAKNIGAVFQERGFATAGIVANVHLQPRFGFDDGFDDWWFDGQAKADEQVDRALAWLDRYRERDTYLFLHLMDPHIFYNAPEPFRSRFVRKADPGLPKHFNRWQVYSMAQTQGLTDQRKRHITDLYDGEVAFMSHELGRLFDALDAMEGNTLVVVHSDHGEEFWEHGGFEHNHTLYREVTRAVLLIRAGRGSTGQQRIDTPVTLADIAPTLYDFAGFDDAPATDGVSLRPLLDGSGTLPERPLGIGHVRYGHERWGVVHDGMKYVLHTGSGREELYDLQADEWERTDLSAERPLAPFRKALGEAHGMEVGVGWRLAVDSRTDDRTPVRLELPRPCIDAGIIDPERVIPNPRNQAWGEPPRRRIEEIGTTALSQDRRTLTWNPGTRPSGGVLWIRFDDDVPLDEARLWRANKPLHMLESALGMEWRAGSMRMTLTSGAIPLPPPSEAERMRALSGTAGSESDDIAELCALGYLDPEECAKLDGHEDAPQ